MSDKLTGRWRFVAGLTHNSSSRLGPLMTAAGRAHAWLFRVSGGRLGRRFFGAPVFVLEVVGRKTGELRSTPLLYVADGDNWAILAANAGNPKAPIWWLNLRAAGRGTAVFGKRRVPISAREATIDERDRLWQKLVDNYPPVAKYPSYTDRRIPIVVLEPEPAA